MPNGTAILRAPALAPFQVRAFRFQWPADLLTSLAFDMELIIVGWYVLVESQSVLLLTVFASLGFLGTLISPMFGVMGDRVGHRNVLCAMRTIYAALATMLMMLAFTAVLTPLIALCIAGLAGLVRPSDIGMRAALIGDSMPRAHLLGAMGIQRMTQDAAKIVGALSGAGMVALLGMGLACAVLAAIYTASVLLTLRSGDARVASVRPAATKAASPVRASPWRDLKEGVAYVRKTPLLQAVMVLAFLLNVTAFPTFMSLLPVVAKEVYGAGQTTLGYMVAAGAFGALLGSITVSRHVSSIRPGRMMLFGCAFWLAAILVFANMPHAAAGIPVLALGGFAQSLGQVSMSAILLRNTEAQYRGRVMGIRTLAIYGNLPGLLLSGPLIVRFGYPATATMYCVFGIGVLVLIALHWRAQLWRLNAPANMR